jgi:hypothetical protein
MGAARKPVLPVMVVCCVLVGWLVWACVPALAAAPEAPEVSVESPVAATAAVLHGVLNPKAAGEAGSYEFLYREGDAGCAGGGKAPEPAGMMLGLEHEEVSETLTGLKPGTEYTVCLQAENASQEATVGPAGTFATPAAPPRVDGESVSEDEEASATLQAQVNPNNQKTTYLFEYSTQATGEVLEGTVSKVDGSAPLTGEYGDQKASAPTGTVLAPGTVYYYRVVASNGTPPASKGKIEQFTTPEAPISESAVTQGSTVVSLAGELNPGGATGEVSYAFAYNDNGTCTGGERTPAIEVTEGKQLHVHVEAQGLTPNEQYTFCLVSTNAYGGEAIGGEVSAQTARQAPAISGASVTKLGSEDSTVSVQIDPYGLPTTDEVQYGPTTSYGSSTAPLSLGSANALVGSEVELGHLMPATEYHYRIVASSVAGSERTADATFTTPGATGLGQSGLPDGRVYEMVTPPENDDADVYVPYTIVETILSRGQAGISTKLLFEASSDGNAFTYVADPTSGGNGNSGFGEGNEYLATRSAAGGWSQTNLQPPGFNSAYYQAFSSDLSVGIVQSGAGESRPEVVNQPLSPEARGENYKMLYTHGLSETDYRPLISKTVPLHRTAGEFGSNGFHTVENTSNGILAYVGGSENMDRLFFEANDTLTENAVDGGVREDNLYESASGKLSLVNVLPGGGSEPNARFGAPGEEYRATPLGPNLNHVISSDGSRAFWTGLGTGDLYMTENAGNPNQRTAQVDEAVGGGGRFWTATGDGSKVFFTKGGLYEYDVNTRVATDLTPGVEVQGVIGASEDGEYVYYVDSDYNLNLWHAGSSKLIATLSPQEGEETLGFNFSHKANGLFGDWQPSLERRTAEVTPDGHSVVFIAFESLTGYHNEGVGEVYIYESETDRLTCVSCNRNGEPLQANVLSENGIGGFLPPSWSATFIPQWMSSDGSRVFFDSSQPLVPQDTNGTLDVYEWERDGSGSCHESVGCVYLLSGGVSSSASNLAGESSSGNDVFIITRAQLGPEDGNEAYDVYDARVDGSQPASPPVCAGTGCQGVPAAPPVFATPPSATFAGIGNFPLPIASRATVKGKALTRAQKLARALKVCKGKRGKGSAACEKTAHKKFGTQVKARKKRVIGARKGGKS